MKQPWNLEEQLQKAWDWLWTDRLEQQKDKNKWKYGATSSAWYVSATDLKRRVRAAAAEIVTGKPYGSLETNDYYENVKVGGLQGLSLLEVCRRWLFYQCRVGKLEVNNPSGKETCSGARFRPKGAAMSPAEQKAPSREEKSRQKWIVHLAREDGKASCGANDKKKSRMTAYPRRNGYKPKPTNEKNKVTCKKCLKLMGQ